MKRQLFIFGLLVSILLSCRKSDIQTVQPVSLSVQLSYNAEDSALGLSKANVPVRLTNLVNGQENTANTNNDGVAIFPSISPGNYTVSASKNYTAEEFYAATNVFVTSNVAYNTIGTQAINVNTSIKLQLQGGKIGDLVFKQIYYAGSNASRGALFRDLFVEVYNNSNQTIYLDSLYIGSTLCSNTRLSAGGVPFDWSKAIGQTGTGDVNRDYLYFRFLFMIPGNGKEHPLEPGKSVVIAETGINHAQPYADVNGTVIGITDPTLTVDLSKADFETYMVEFLRLEAGSGSYTPWRYDLDNPSVKNLDILMSSGNDWIMDANSRDDFIIFKAPGKNIRSLPKYLPPSGGGSDYALQVPMSVSIIDAVELITPLETARVPKRLPVGLDAVGTFVTGSLYSSQSLIRKTVKTVEGRRILQDTNNSSNDFETKSKADPSKTDASFLK